MKIRWLFALLMLVLACGIGRFAAAQDIAEWQAIAVPGRWERIKVESAFPWAQVDGEAWYLSAIELQSVDPNASATLELGTVDDADQTFVNGTQVGATGGFPPTVATAWSVERKYRVPAGLLREGLNVIAVQVYDSGGLGGLGSSGAPVVLESNGTRFDLSGPWLFFPGALTDALPSAQAIMARQRELIDDANSLPGRAVRTLRSKTEAPQAIGDGSTILWYREPAHQWTQALPVGNGALGAMCYGDPDLRVQLNHDELWAGTPMKREPDVPAGALDEVRRLWFDGEVVAAQKLAQNSFMSPRLIRSHQTLGDLHFTRDVNATFNDYQRTLDLRTGVALATWTENGVPCKEEVFSSAIDDVLAIRSYRDDAPPLTGTLVYERKAPLDCNVERVSDPDLGVQYILLSGRVANTDQPGAAFVMGMVILTQPKKGLGAFDAQCGDTVRITQRLENIENFAVLVSCATQLRTSDADSRGIVLDRLRRAVTRVKRESWESLRTPHVEEHYKMFNRVELDLGVDASSRLPTDQRLAAFRSAGAENSDPSFTALYFNFGRYLLMGSSRPGTMPANLQGIWNEHIKAPWNADFHININLQMNYWPTEVTNLAECHEPLLEWLLPAMAVRGATTARELYGANGWVAHHVTDGLAQTPAVGRTVWGLWPLGGAWCTRHAWEHHLYGGSIEKLRERDWPILRGSAEFFVDYLCEDPRTGLLVSGPATSPENTFVTADGQRANVGMGNAMDQQVVWDVFKNTLDAAEVLGITDAQDPVVAAVRAALPRLAPTRIGEDGRIMEWSRPFGEAEPGHRHISHLYGLHPGAQFTPGKTPAYADAARASLAHRLANGGGHTGWSRAWLINMYARLHDAAEALKHLRLLYAKSTLPNLFDNHPPFQIDGNFGGCAAIAEMLVQSHERPGLDNAAPNETFLIDLMPAWPAAFAEGSVAGLRCRGAVDLLLMKWSSGQPTEARFRVGRGTELVLRLPEGIVVDESTHRFAQRDREVVFQVNTGDEVKVQFAAR